MIFHNAAAVDLSIADYGLPEDMEEFKKQSKTKNSKKDHRFRTLFKALRAANAPDFQTLETWIAYLRSFNYKADVSELKNLQVLKLN